MKTESRRGQKRGWSSSYPLLLRLLVTSVLALLFVETTAGSGEEKLTFPRFRITVATGWKHRVDDRPRVGDERGALVTIFHPDRDDVLRIQSYVAPGEVSADDLRNLTNVEAATQLVWQKWGDFSGYEFSYMEREKFFKQWWLLEERVLLFITYDHISDGRQIEIEVVDEMVNSLRKNRRGVQ